MFGEIFFFSEYFLEDYDLVYFCCELVVFCGGFVGLKLGYILEMIGFVIDFSVGARVRKIGS